MKSRENSLPAAITRAVPILALAGAIGFAATKYEGCGGDPETQVTPTPGSILRAVRASDVQPFIEFEGLSGSRAEEDGPIFSDNKYSEAEVSGVAEFRAPLGALHESYYLLPGSKTGKKKYGVKVNVDSEKIHILPSMSTHFVDGKPQVSAGEQFFGFSTFKGISKRSAIADTAARADFVYTCGKAVRSTLVGGIQYIEKRKFESVARVQEATPGQEQVGAATRQMIQDKRTIKVTFTKPTRLPSGEIVRQPISAAEIQLKWRNPAYFPTRIEPIPNGQTVVNKLLQNNDSIKLPKRNSVCTTTKEVLDQINKLSGAKTPTPEA